jgi:hypothetical protein
MQKLQRRDGKAKVVFIASFVFVCVFTLSPFLFQAVHAQNVSHPFQVFVDLDVDNAGLDRVIFLDVVTGEQTDALIDGERYTLLADRLMYRDRTSDQIMLITPDGRIEAHPFMQKPQGARRIDWLLSPDKTRLAWTITGGTPDALTTQTFTADVNGVVIRDVLTDGARGGIRAYPVAFNPDHSVLYLDYTPDAIGEFAPLRQYAGLFGVDIATGQIIELPGEPGCFCGAGFGAHQFVRLTLAGGLNGFDVRLVDLRTRSERMIPSLNLINFTQSGDVIISPNGQYAVYTLAQIRGFGTPGQTIQSVFVRVDMLSGTQQVLTQPANSLFRPVAWTDQNRALFVTSPALNGTWKVDLAGGDLQRIAASAYLGEITSGSA